jgi:transcriptional regulator with XRE-family HTH domain
MKMTWMRVRGNMMKMREQSWNARNHFGSFLREKRDSLSMSLSDMGYVLNLNYGTVWNWEIGGSFPANIIRLKQLALVYPGVHDEMKRIFQLPDVKPTDEQWDNLVSRLSTTGPIDRAALSVRGFHADTRIDSYKKAFGKYLRERRLDSGYTARGLARGMGLSSGTTCLQWEAGLNFPQDIVCLIMLDRLYGDTLDVIFGICADYGIHLKHTEKRDVLSRLKKFEGTKMNDAGKPRDANVKAYHDKYREDRRREKVIPNSCRRALSILDRRGPMTVRKFARAVWTGSDCWKKKVARRTPFGDVSGPVHMDAVALAFISRLHKSGLIERVQGKARKSEKIEISHEGRLKLRKHPR